MNHTLWAEYHNKTYTKIRATLDKKCIQYFGFRVLAIYRRFDYAGLLPIRSLTQIRVLQWTDPDFFDTHQATTRKIQIYIIYVFKEIWVWARSTRHKNKLQKLIFCTWNCSGRPDFARREEERIFSLKNSNLLMSHTLPTFGHTRSK